MSRRHILYAPTGHTAYNHVGAVGADNPVLEGAERAITYAGVGVGAYHGYKRNGSVGWAIVWGVLGGLFPLITGGVALAQGLGKKKGS